MAGYRDSLKQEQVQRQQLKLSPAQVRFGQMLEMTGPELEEAVRNEIEDNPALEKVDEVMALNTNDDGETAEQMQLADYRGDDIPAYRLEARNHSADDLYIEPVVVAGYNLLDYLMEQLAQSGADRDVLDVAPYIVGNLDANGYLSRSLISIANDIAMTTGIDVEDETVQRAFEAVRALDPPGIGAVDLRDCLLLQLQRRRPTPLNDLAIEIVENNFEAFSHRHFDRLASALNIDKKRLNEAQDIIRGLNPKPAAAFDGGADNDVARAIVPDFSVDVDGEVLTLSLLNNIPELRIDATFSGDISVSGRDAKANRDVLQFINARRDRAEEFIRLLRQRQETLFRVMTAIMKVQRDFFLTGDETRLRPMILKDIAALTGYDLSVISRATAAKYVTTPTGTYPLKYFFNERLSAVGSEGEVDASSLQVMARIKAIIEGEDPGHPLSDNALTNLLNNEGIGVKRRTVTKYRENLGLPVARLRRKI